MSEFSLWRPLRYFPRKLVHRPGEWWRWVLDGRPLDEPVVRVRGRQVICVHGHNLLEGWSWETQHQVSGVSLDELARRYYERYGAEWGPLAECPDCKAQR